MKISDFFKKFLLSLVVLPLLAQGQDCKDKNQEAQNLTTGNLGSLTKTFSVVFKDKTYNSLHYLIQVAGNDEIKDDSDVITQKELQETLRYVHQDGLTYDDLKKMQQDLVNQRDFQRLTELQKIDVQRVLTDILHVENRMNHYRNVSNMYCRFALSDNPFDQFPKDSIFRSEIDPDKRDPQLESIVQMKKNRSVCGLCWYKKKKTNF